MNEESVPPPRQLLAKTLGQLWGIFVLMILFGTGGFLLLAKGFRIWQESPPLEDWEYLLYGFFIIFGGGKAEFLFRRNFIPRLLARARDALGETGWSGDYWLAPICMVSFYRPWQKKHQIMSLVIVLATVGLAALFYFGPINHTFKGAVDLAIGFALAYAALIYLIAFLRVLVWRLGGAKEENCPLPKWLGPKGAARAEAPTPSVVGAAPVQ